MNQRIKTIVKGVLILIVGVVVLYEGTKWTAMRVYVPPGKALMVINKFGDALPADLIAVPGNQNHYKGVEEQLRSPGRYFINPFEYDTQVVDQTIIPAGDPQTWPRRHSGAHPC